MPDRLSGLRIAFLAAEGVEEIEFKTPWQAVENEGAEPELISLRVGTIQAFRWPDHGEALHVDRAVRDASVDDYHGLVLPGGTAGPDFLRADPDAVRFVRDFHLADKPIAAICHAPWLFIEAGVVRNRRVTSWPSLRTDIENAGGIWIDQEVVIDAGLISSRNSEDLPAFCNMLIKEFSQTASPGTRL